jgi:divalent metal cation (Fe/Co/Zn/Cd) transporter
MTQWLMKTFIKNNQNTNDSSVRSASGRMASLVGVSCNVSLALGKFLIALLSGSVSIMADAVNNLSDAASSIISLLGFKMAAKPADVGHPYGHARYDKPG